MSSWPMISELIIFSCFFHLFIECLVALDRPKMIRIVVPWKKAKFKIMIALFKPPHKNRKNLSESWSRWETTINARHFKSYLEFSVFKLLALVYTLPVFPLLDCILFLFNPLPHRADPDQAALIRSTLLAYGNMIHLILY